MQLEKACVVITGGATGIGRATALSLAKRGARVTLGGRREGPLKETAREIAKAGGEAESVAGDVRDPSYQDRLVEAGWERFGRIDVLINNAGVVRAGRIEGEPDDELQAQIETNLTAPLQLTRRALPALRQSTPSAVVNVASVFGLHGMPFYATYGATKAGIARFSEALRRELHGEGVHVMTVYPGPTDTPMMETAEFGPEHGITYEPPEAVAAALIEGLEQDAAEVVRGDPDLIETNWRNPEAVDEQIGGSKESFEAAAARHRHL